MYGKHHSEESKRKIREKLKGRKLPDSTKQKMRKSSKKNEEHHKATSVVQLTKDGEYIKTYLTIKEAAIETGANRSNISECCRGIRKFAKGFKWIYEKDYLKELN